MRRYRLLPEDYLHSVGIKIVPRAVPPETNTLPLPPDSTKAPRIKPPEDTTILGVPLVPPTTSAEIASPPDETVSRPAESMIPLTSLPPALTISRPLLDTVVLLAVPPDEIVSWPLLLTAALKTTPPELTISRPPLPMMVPIAVPPGTAELEPKGAKPSRSKPPERVALIDVPPVNTREVAARIYNVIARRAAR